MKMDINRRYLALAVFTSGMTTLAMEITASRLLGNVFGTSNIVWANIIGLILVYLTLGYYIGGRIADRWPFESMFYRLLAWGAFLAGIIPIVSRPVLLAAANAVELLDAAVMIGTFLVVLILFSIPVTILGFTSPYAIRLSLKDTEHAGRTSGWVYAVSTLGSILGTFLPVLILIPLIGTARTFILFSLILLVVALIGLWRSDRRLAIYHLWMPIVIIILSALLLSGSMKSIEGQVYETESGYNYIQVVERDGVRQLLLNEGQGVHSVYAPGLMLTNGTWDLFLAAPFFNPPTESGIQLDRVGLVGLAAGTISKQYTQNFGPIPIDGWEIDPKIVNVGREWFEMNEPNLNVIVADGRWGLGQSDEVYDVIGIDAYRLPYIPWHLTTREFFQEVEAHLSPTGVVVINVGRTPDDRRLIDAMASTIGSVFSSVHVVDVPYTFNTIIYGTVQPTSPENIFLHAAQLEVSRSSPLLLEVLTRVIENLQPVPEAGIIFTDDKAPIERITNAMVIEFILGSNLEVLR
jgi:spermidine synthase